MDTSNNISFKAKLVTKMNGRHNITKKVVENFSKRTKKLPGELQVYRNNAEYPGAIVFNLDDKKGYILSDYADLFGANLKSPNEINHNLVNRITTTFINIYKALAADIKFDEYSSSMFEKIKSVRKELKVNESYYEKAIASGNYKFSNVFAYLVEQNKAKLESLEKSYNQGVERYLTKLVTMAEREPKLKVWSQVVSDNF